MSKTRTSGQDWRATTALIADAAGSATLYDLVDCILRHLHALFDAELVVWDRFDGQARQQAYRMFPAQGAHIHRLQPAFAAYWHQHPFCHDWIKLIGHGRVAILSDRISTRDFLRTDLWREVYIHLRAKHQIAFGGRIDDGSYWSIGCNRLRPDYGSRERELSRFLQPHLNALFQRTARRERTVKTLEIAARYFSSADASYLMVDAEERITEISPEARKLVADSKPAVELGARLGELGVNVRSSGPNQSISEHRVVGLSAVLIRPTPAGPALILIIPPGKGRPAENPPKITARESEILHWIGQGKNSREVGRLLGISPRTVEKHCERLFEKLGVENRLGIALFARQPR